MSAKVVAIDIFIIIVGVFVAELLIDKYRGK